MVEELTEFSAGVGFETGAIKTLAGLETVELGGGHEILDKTLETLETADEWLERLGELERLAIDEGLVEVAVTDGTPRVE